jgi:hypothetical protein
VVVPPLTPPITPSTSSDDLGLTLTELPPDPFLGELVEGEQSQALTEPGPAGGRDATPGTFEAVNFPEPIPSGLPVVGPEPRPKSEISSFLHVAPSEVPAPALTVPPRAVAVELPTGGASAVSADPFPALDLSAPPSRAEAAKRPHKEDEEEEGDLPPRGVSWPVLLLASVNSALLIFLGWHFYKEHRTPREAAEPNSAPIVAEAGVEESPDPGRRAGQSGRYVPPPPIAADHLTTLGKALRVGSLEITPTGLTSGPVTLQREVLSSERRKAGSGALKLRLRLRNISDDLIFFPLDEVFLRERERGGFDSFIDAGQETSIDMYPLALASEWSIVGQEFRKLKPGEAYETLVVSAPDAVKRKSPEMTWRIRIRTGIEQTDVIGVRFRDSEIRPEPEPQPKEKPRSDGKQPLKD